MEPGVEWNSLASKAVLAAALLKQYWVHLFFVFLAYRFIQRRYFHPLSGFPGPFLASITNWYSVWVYFTWDMQRWEKELHEKYGPVVRYTPHLLLISDHKYLPIVYHLAVDKREGFQDMKISGLGDAVITAIDHKDHARLKKRVAGAYSMTNIRRMEHIIDGHVISLLRHLNNRFAKPGKLCDFAKWIQYFAYDVVTDVAFGRAIGFMEAGKDLGGFVDYMRSSLPATAVLTRVRWLQLLVEATPGMGYFMPKKSDKLGAGAMYRFRDELIEERAKTRDDASQRPDLLSHFLKAKNEDGSPMSLKEIGDESFLIMLAGSDTTALVFRYLFRQLLIPSNRSILDQLLQEITELELPNNAVPSYDTLQQLTYFQAVLSEGLRLGALPLFIPRRVTAPGFEINGYHVPGGAAVAMNPWVVARDKTLWGEDAEVFKPARWLGISKEEKWHYQKYADFTWGYGSRGCLGKNIALMEIHKATFMLLRLFDMQLKEDGEDVPYPHVVKNLSLFMEEGMWFDIKAKEEIQNYASVL
ncbi:cytochrome P450 [Ascobolus immersus RN42]|uniref:Cytochrome P450 n=1 Tax=Ascobolus immersus RN42 TaxID=1160509 RepID=A0A3N4IIA6_ASCIM|nr:cytochrome P450 [Ascobolus immersus RN42]